MRRKPMEPAAGLEPADALIAELRRLNALLEQQVKYQRSWRIPLRNGLIAGFGGVIGATLVVSMLAAALKPFRAVPGIAPALDRIATALEQKK